MWGRKTKEQKEQQTKENAKEKANVENRLTDVEVRLDVLADRVDVISRNQQDNKA